ncbi:MAG: tetratricopeptide repeat protein [Methylotenera sp.]|nr:tetratricopeptide repeat protein [Methylotenera sp.]
MLENQNAPTITFFYTDNCERQALEPIANEAKIRGIEVLFSTNSKELAQIGVYCEHACTPNADFSVILLHDLAQRHDIWPNFWHYEPWSKFDIGCIPGQSWVERWQNQADFPMARPRLGMFDLGWPKADLVFKDRSRFAQEAQKLRETLGLKYEKSVLYAPSWENHGKQDDFVQAFKDLPVNVLLKQAPWSNSYPQVLENIRQMNELHQGCAENVHIIDVEVSIMYCLSLADVLVSDESSVLTEALLLDVPGVAVTDWLIPDTIPPRPASVPYDYVTKTTKAEMRQVVQAILAEPEVSRTKTRFDRDYQFSHLGESSIRVMDNIVAGYRGQALPYSPVVAQVDIDRLHYQRAEQLIAANEMAAGVNILLDLLKAETVCWEAYNDLGDLSFKDGNVEDAIFLLQKAIAISPQPSVPLCNLTEIYCATNQQDKALATLAQLGRHTLTSEHAISSIRACMMALMSA